MAMDEKSVRAEVERLQKDLADIEAKRQSLQLQITGLTEWLRSQFQAPAKRSAWHAAAEVVGTAVGAMAQQYINGVATQRNVISVRQAVLRTLQEANGQPMHSRDILAQVQALGLVVNGERPENIIDLTAHSLSRTQPVRKMGPRMWVWQQPVMELPDESAPRLEETPMEVETQ